MTYVMLINFFRYLTADQLVGPSAVEAYIRALKRGCRCVECKYGCYETLKVMKMNLLIMWFLYKVIP